MNGAIFETTGNVFHRLRYVKMYDAVLATPLGSADVAVGEITFALIRGQLAGSPALEARVDTLHHFTGRAMSRYSDDRKMNARNPMVAMDSGISLRTSAW